MSDCFGELLNARSAMRGRFCRRRANLRLHFIIFSCANIVFSELCTGY